MIQRISLRNFKSAENLTLEPGLITVLIGANGTGKSSALQALGLLKQSRQDTRLDIHGPLLNLGSYADVVHLHDTRRRIGISLVGSVNAVGELDVRPFASGPIRYEHSVQADEYGVFAQEAYVAVKPFEIRTQWSRSGTRSSVSLDLQVPGLPFAIKAPFAGTERIGEPIATGGIATPHITDPTVAELVRDVQASLARLTRVFSRVLENIFIIPAFRGFDTRTIPLTQQIATDFISPEGATKQASELATALLHAREVERKISAWSERITGNAVVVRFAGASQASVDSARPEITINIVNEGTGSNQLIFPLAQLALAPADAFIGIEEPEIHLHPKAQAQLSDVLVDIATGESKQLLLTTHSEHILLRLLTNVSEGKVKPHDLAVYFFRKEGSASTAERLPVNERGQVRGGLPGFFEADLAELDRYVTALDQK